MSGAFPIVLVVVCILGVAVPLTRFLQPWVLGEAGQSNRTSIDHPEDHAAGDGPGAVSADSPLLHRRLRGRLD